MWKISKMADHERNRRKFGTLGTGYYSAQICGTFDAQFLEFALGSIRCTSQNFQIDDFQNQLLSQFSPDFNETLL